MNTTNYTFLVACLLGEGFHNAFASSVLRNTAARFQNSSTAINPRNSGNWTFINRPFSNIVDVPAYQYKPPAGSTQSYAQIPATFRNINAAQAPKPTGSIFYNLATKPGFDKFIQQFDKPEQQRQQVQDDSSDEEEYFNALTGEPESLNSNDPNGSDAYGGSLSEIYERGDVINDEIKYELVDPHDPDFANKPVPAKADQQKPSSMDQTSLFHHHIGTRPNPLLIDKKHRKRGSPKSFN